MDVTGDGKIDLLSGCYSDHDPMAGLFQVLKGSAEGFAKAEPLQGADGNPLILPFADADAEDDEDGGDIIDRICTRPSAADLDGDGQLDLVIGNFRGQFAFWRGSAAGRFAAAPTWLTSSDGARLAVGFHGDPCLVDWDQDGDLDIVSGSGGGEISLALNRGNPREPRFEAFAEIYPAPKQKPEEVMPDDRHIQRPASSTRVWADDIDGDGKLDLLVGDQFTLRIPAPGITLERAKAAQQEFNTATAALQEIFADLDPTDEAAQAAASKAWSEGYNAARKARAPFVDERVTGTVWLLRQK